MQAKELAAAGISLKPGKDDTMILATPEEVLMEWPEPVVPAAAPVEVAAK